MLSDAFVRDLQQGTTSRVSVTSAGEQVASTSSGPMLSPDGRSVVFETSARLVAKDQNSETDVYLYDRLGDPPSLIDLGPNDGAAVTTSTPTLAATYEDPNPGDDGHVEFEVYQDGNLVASNASASPATVQHGQTATWQVPEGTLQGGRTYSWRARDVGFERFRSSDVGPTATYTVLTDKTSGDLFNMYPGEPAERWNE
jgi:hypothetical protein